MVRYYQLIADFEQTDFTSFSIKTPSQSQDPLQDIMWHLILMISESLSFFVLRSSGQEIRRMALSVIWSLVLLGFWKGQHRNEMSFDYITSVTSPDVHHVTGDLHPVIWSLKFPYSKIRMFFFPKFSLLRFRVITSHRVGGTGRVISTYTVSGNYFLTIK